MAWGGKRWDEKRRRNNLIKCLLFTRHHAGSCSGPLFLPGKHPFPFLPEIASSFPWWDIPISFHTVNQCWSQQKTHSYSESAIGSGMGLRLSRISESQDDQLGSAHFLLGIQAERMLWDWSDWCPPLHCRGQPFWEWSWLGGEWKQDGQRLQMTLFKQWIQLSLKQELLLVPLLWAEQTSFLV